METCDKLPKKRKRSFVAAWLNDERYNNWIRQVSDETLYHCTICKKNFSCTSAHVSRHADSACHRNSLKENTSSANDGVNIRRTLNKPVFKIEWLDMNDFKLWLRKVPNDASLCICVICDKSFTANLSNVRRHAESISHLNMCQNEGIEANESTDFDMQNKEFPLSFAERKKAAEIQYAALIAEKNIPYKTAKEILTFFQQIGQDPNVLKSMTMGRTKCYNIISNVLCRVENTNVTQMLQRTKFSVFVDETSDITNEKWMTFFVRYIDPETLDVRSQLVDLININAAEGKAEMLFDAFKNKMFKLQIPFCNIIALSCDNASVMTGKNSSFKTQLEKMCKNLLTFPCPCHSAALAAHAANEKIPECCEEFLNRIAHYINSSPKRTRLFRDCCDAFDEKHRKILKLSRTRWLSHHKCVERLIDSWNTVRLFLQETVVSDKTKSGEHLLSMMDNVELKAYFLFLKYILHFFNLFNAFFQSTETRIHLLQLKSKNFLSQVCQNFIKKEYLKDVATNINFSQKEVQKDANGIFLGTECEEYLNDIMMEGHADIVTTVRQNCLQYYVTAAEEIRKRLPITNEFLNKLQVFLSSVALFDGNRETTFQHVSFVARTLGGFDEESLKTEWLALPTDFTAEEKTNLSKLCFDDMWKEILQRQLSNTYKYPNLRDILSAVRSLPNSNADSERTFSVLTDVKSKRRNALSSTSVNATCVVKSALKARNETAVNMQVTEQHLSCMTTNNLYANCSKKQKSKLTLYAADGSLFTS